LITVRGKGPWRPSRGARCVGALAVGAVALTACSSHAATSRGEITVSVAPQPAASFRPLDALGGAIDGQDQGVVRQMYTPKNLDVMQSAGLGSLTYRLRTELADEAWHWNPEGTWSDPARQRGYWTSSTTSSAPIDITYGYRLPRRGNTNDQANDDGYSRLDDGDPNSFWKSNPYLDQRYTGEDNALHPQWVVIDLGKSQPVDAVQLSWGTPYAVDYQVQYWDGEDPFSISTGTKERWRTFPNGTVTNATGGDATVQVDPSGNTDARFVRVLMTRSSELAPPGSTDPRDGAGYALREVHIGTKDPESPLVDLVHHGATASTQSPAYVSSTDPWHQATDRDPRTEQPGFDRVKQSGLLKGVPAMVPVPVLFSTPEDARAELIYLQSHQFPVNRVELGEEPDGQNVLPEDYAALYIQWANALRTVEPGVQLGGPSFQTGFEEVVAWPDDAGETSWLRRFVSYLTRHSALGQFNFFSAEWYPFDDPCSPVAANLAHESQLLASAYRQWHADGVPANVPTVVSEYGYSAQAAEPEVDLPGAVLNADFAAQFLTLGGSAAYLYGYEPNVLDRYPGCSGWGNNMLFKADDNYQVNDEMATYWAAKLLTQNWAQPGNEPHALYVATVRGADGHAAPVAAYPVHRPDGRWAILVVNKDAHHTWRLDARFVDQVSRAAGSFAGPVALFQFGPEQYAWAPNGDHGQTSRSDPPTEIDLSGSQSFTVPPYSISVLVGARP
jgi:hypothetical protein